MGVFRRKVPAHYIPVHPDNIGKNDWIILLEAGTIVCPSAEKLRVARATLRCRGGNPSLRSARPTRARLRRPLCLSSITPSTEVETKAIAAQNQPTYAAASVAKAA